MTSAPAPPDPSDELAELQDLLSDLVVARVSQPRATDALPGLRRDAQQAAAIAEELADTALRLSDADAPPQ
jgi:hypothetical protein